MLEGTIESVRLDTERFRLVVMNQLIEHVVDPVRVLQKLKEALVPGGVAFIETPNTSSPNARWMRRTLWGGYHYPRHLHLFSPTTIQLALEAAGLELVQIRFVPCPVQWVLSLNNFLKLRRRPWALALKLTDWRNPALLAVFTVLDMLLSPLGTANMQVVARRPLDPA